MLPKTVAGILKFTAANEIQLQRIEQENPNSCISSLSGEELLSQPNESAGRATGETQQRGITRRIRRRYYIVTTNNDTNLKYPSTGLYH